MQDNRQIKKDIRQLKRDIDSFRRKKPFSFTSKIKKNGKYVEEGQTLSD